MSSLIVKAIMEGGPIGLGLIGWLAWWHERKINKEANQKLLELATAQIEATLKHEMTIEANTKLMERMLDR